MAPKIISPAKNYLFKNGREIEQAIFQSVIEEQNSKNFNTLLTEYQNQDGGFGNALEPDIRSSLSSNITTSYALKLIRQFPEMGIDNKIIFKALEFLLENFDSSTNTWDMFPKKVTESPCAFWWQYEGISDRFGHFLVNPTVSIISHFLHFDVEHFAEFSGKLQKIAVERMESFSEKSDIYELRCWVDLLHAKNLESSIKSNLQEKFKTLIPKLVSKSPEEWTGHGIAPITFLGYKDSPLRELIEPRLIRENLKQIKETQLDDGTWKIPWDWSPLNKEAWNQAEMDWKGIFILNNLTSLSRITF